MTAPPKRRWFRFSLRTIFVVVTVFGVWLGWQLKIVRERQAILAELSQLVGQGDIGYSTIEDLEQSRQTKITDREYQRVSRIRRLLGDKSYIHIDIVVPLKNDMILRMDQAFPEAEMFLNSVSVSPDSSEQQFRNSLYKPVEQRVPNNGTVFKTGLIEK